MDNLQARAFVCRRWVNILVFRWSIDYDAFCALLRRMTDSVPGPDGPPSSARGRAPDCVKGILYAACSAFLEGRELPAGFNHAFMAMLAKGDQPSDGAMVSRIPEGTRPRRRSSTEAPMRPPRATQRMNMRLLEPTV